MHRTSIFVAALVVCFTALTASGYGATEARYVAGERTSLSYKLTNSRTINQGQTISDASGVLTYDYVIEADAAPGGRAGNGNAVFRAKLSSFRPSRNMPGQQAGKWYLQGVWTIEPTGLTDPSTEKRHESVRYRGALESTLDFDPLGNSGKLSATLKVPTSLLEAGWLSGTGSFTGDTSFRGTITIDIDKPIQAEAVEKKEVGRE